eukprot:397310_1
MATNFDQPLINENDNIQPKCQCICRYWLPRRYCIVLMAFWGLFNVYAMRVNLSVAIEPMSCQFNWNSFTEGFILSAFFAGYLFGNIPGGFLADKFGGKLVFGIGVLATSILTVLLPVCTSGQFANDESLSCYCKHESGWCFNKGNFTNKYETCNPIIASRVLCDVDSYIWILIIVRFFMGLFESVTFPALYALLNYWTTDSERSRMIGISFAGMYIGNVLGFPLSSFIIASDNKIYGGWPNVFYFFSIMGILWWICWVIFVTDSPFNDPFISGKEFKYLRTELPSALINKYEKKIKKHYEGEFVDNSEHNNDNTIVISKENWIGFFTHPAALVLYFTHFSYNWSFYTLLVELPTYLDDELNFNLSKAGFVSVLPYFLQFLVSAFGSILVDKLIIYNVLSRVNARKTAQTIGTIIPGLLLILCGYINNSTYVIALLSFATALMGIVNSGFAANYADVSPTMSGIMYGIGNTAGTIPGVISPIICGWILQGDNKKFEWKLIFYIAFVIFVIGTTCFWKWGTADKIDVLNKKEISQNINVDESISRVDIQ